MKRLTKHLIVRFVLSGGISAAVNVGILSVLYYIFGVFYITASIVAFMVAFLFSMTLQKFWTFKDKSLNGLHWQTGKYLATSIFGLGINTFFLYIFVDHFNLYVFVGQILAGLITGICTFFLSSDYVFHNKSSLFEVKI